MTTELSFTDVTLTFPDGKDRVTAVNNVSFTLKPGELISITGPSGSGKSSLLALAATLITPDSGSIMLGDTELARLSGRQAAECRRNLGDCADRRVGALSGGQRQRVNIARALMNSPELLVVDEPTSALDSQRSRIVMELLLDLVRSENVGTLLVTHDRDAADHADRELTMTDGKLSPVV